MKHSNVFYRRTKDGIEPVKDAKALRNKVGLDLFRINYKIYEGKTGLLVSSDNSKEEMQDTLQKLETDGNLRAKIDSEIEQNIKKYGLSPRYERADERYEDLFPSKPTPKCVLAPVLNGEKHYFIEVFHENGIELYKEKSQKNSPYALLYLFYNGWMLGMDNALNKEQTIEKLSKGIPDYRQIMTDSLNEALADPNKWADRGFANFLDRIDEADKHNQPISERREAEQAARYQEQERVAETERQQEEAKYRDDVFNAEQAILNKNPVIDKPVRGTSLILCLFRENKVDVPLKTQGWIKSSLHSVYYGEDHDWSFRYFGNLSNSFGRCFTRLVDAIERKYDNILNQDQQDNELTDDEPER